VSRAGQAAAAAEASAGEPADPLWVSDIPMCRDGCCHHDGKRCELTGFRPGSLCEPAVGAMAVMLNSLTAKGAGR